MFIIFFLMKDFVIKWSIWLLWWGILLYALRLLSQWATIIDPQFVEANIWAYIYVIIIALFLIALIIKETLLPDNRRGLLVLGIAIILTSHLYLRDNADLHIYLADIMKLLWVILVVVWPTNMLVTKAYEEKKFEEEIEIIEV